MHHSRKTAGIRRGRVVAVAASVLTVGVAMLASTGIIPVTTSSGDTALAEERAAQTEQRGAVAANRASDRAEAPPQNAADTGGQQQRQSGQAAEQRRTSATSAEDSLPANSGKGKRIVYRLSTNQVWLVGGDGNVRRSYLVSGTKFDQVDPGTYDVLRKRRNTVSYHGTESMQYMVTFTEGENAAIGFHDIPVDLDDGTPVQSLSELGKSLSDGCIRQKKEDARALWKFAPVGTRVVVLA